MRNALSLFGNYDKTEIVDPYGKKDHQFRNEEDAYTYFAENVGVENYCEMLYSKLQGSEKSKQVLLGFSIGASAAWLLSGKLESFSNTKAIGFYSSQIRNYLDVTPKIKIELYFSKYEQTYDVDEIQQVLSCKAEVTCHRTPYLHGFMNKRSKNYNREGMSEYLKILNRA